MIASKVRYYALQKHAQLLVQQALKFHQKKDDLDLHTEIKDQVARFRMETLAANVMKNIETVEEIFKELTALNFMGTSSAAWVSPYFLRCWLLVRSCYPASLALGFGLHFADICLHGL